MAFNLPLPRVVADVGPGGGIPTALSALNALQGQRYQNQILQSNAQYAPYTNYANALSKIAYANYLPYQLQAQVLTNPMAMLALKDNPEALTQMLQAFGKSIPSSQSVLGNVNMPMPSQRSNNVFDLLMNRILGGQNQGIAPQNNIIGQGNVNPLAQPTSQAQAGGQSNPFIPSAGGTTEAIIGGATAPVYAQKQKPGTSFYDPKTNTYISAPTNEMVTASQKSINAVQRVTPQLQRLADEAAPFMTLSGLGMTQAERIWNALVPNKAGDLPTKYAKYQATLKAAPESLLKAYGLNPTDDTIKLMREVIEPYFGETADQYKSRMLGQLEEIKKEQVEIPSKQLSRGFELGTNEPAQAPNVPATTQNPGAEITITTPRGEEEYNPYTDSGKEIPEGNVLMYNRSNQLVPVHKSNIEYAKKVLKYRDRESAAKKK